jgi:hypothetical protein
MTDIAPGMRGQTAGQSVIEELLRQQLGTRERNWFGRLIGDSPLGADSLPWYRGALGEIAVGRILATLPAGWTVFHALPIGKKGADIDHVVIGPGGIFTINTKNHSGKAVWVAGQTLMVSGQKQPHIRNAEFEATWVTTLLRARMPSLPPVQPVVAVLEPKSLLIKVKPERVAVLNAAQLPRWLRKRPVVFTAEHLAGLAAIIDDRATWPAPVFTPMENAARRFAELDSQVRAARRRKTLLGLLGTALLIGGFYAGIHLLLPAYIASITGG